jgi:mannose-6-phosphate isomerase-like protein (cupin superfamily)
VKVEGNALHFLEGIKMHHFKIEPENGFHVVAKSSKSECATMVIEPGNSEGGPDNKHRADQWLYVLDGEGQATVEGEHITLSAGTLLEIEAGERHEIRNTGDALLRTLNFYAPPEY